MWKKLKAAYTLIEQLYTGAQRVICAASYNKPPPTLIKDTLARLSMTPAQLEEVKKSAARAGALSALTRAKAWIADLDPEDIGNGYPSQKEDGSEFDNAALKALTKKCAHLQVDWPNKLICHFTGPSMMQTIDGSMHRFMRPKI